MKKKIILNSMLVLAIELLALSTITFSSKEAKAERVVYSAGISK